MAASAGAGLGELVEDGGPDALQLAPGRGAPAGGSPRGGVLAALGGSASAAAAGTLRRHLAGSAAPLRPGVAGAGAPAGGAASEGGPRRPRAQRPRSTCDRPRGGAPLLAELRLEALDPPQQALGGRVEIGAGGLQQGDLDRHAGVVALAHRGQRGRQLVDRPHQRGGADRGRLRLQALGVGGGDDEGGRHLAGGLGDQQVAQVGEQVAGELGGSRPERAIFSTPSRTALGSAAATASTASKSSSASAAPSISSTSSSPTSAAAEGDQLVERAERVAEAALGRAGDHRRRSLLELDRLGRGDPVQHLGDLLQRRPLEVEALAAVGDRRHHLVRLGRGEDEDGVRRRLLERLEEGVPGLLGQHVRLVEDVDLPVAAGRRVGDPLAQLADVVDRAVGGGVHLDHVDRGAGGDRQAGLALAAGGDGRAAALAVERAGEDLRHRGLAGPARADEEVGVVDLALLDRVAQGADDVLLADDLVEGAGPVAAVEGGRLGAS